MNEKYQHHLGRLKEMKIRLAQDRAEFLTLCENIAELQPRVLVEIGTRDGGSLYMLAHHAPVDCLIVSIDLPGGAWGNNSSATSRQRVVTELGSDGYEVITIDGDSKSPKTIEALSEVLSGRSIDALFIDGDHCFDGVLADWKNYHPYVRDGGLIAFHDVNYAEHLPKVQVPFLWRTLKCFYEHEELITNPGKGFGIGILKNTRTVTA